MGINEAICKCGHILIFIQGRWLHKCGPKCMMPRAIRIRTDEIHGHLQCPEKKENNTMCKCDNPRVKSNGQNPN